MKNSIENERKQHGHYVPSMLLAGLKGIIAVVGAMLLISLAIWLRQ